MGDQSQPSRFRALFESAFHDYQIQTGTPLPSHPLAEKLQNCDSVESVTAVLQDQARAFSEVRGDNGRISKSLKGVVSVLYTLSASIASIGLPFLPTNTIFTGIAVLLAAVKDVSSSYDALVDLLESIQHFMSRLDIYTRVPSTEAMTEIIVKIMVETISTLALVTKQIKQRRPMKLVKKLLGENEVSAVLQRLDRLTLDEARTTAAQTLQVVYGLVQNMRVVIDDGKSSVDSVQDALEIIQQLASDMNKSKRDKLQGDIRNWLSPPDPWKNHNIACGSRHIGTAKWFIQSDTFSEWKSSGPSSLLWVHGKPGAGKSVLCSAIVENIDGMRKLGLASMAFFYCDFREEQKKHSRGLLSSWLVQLCHQSDAYSDILSNFYLEHSNGSRQPSDGALIKCLKEILELPRQAHVYLIVDALDECPMTSSVSSPRDKVLMAVENLIDSQFPNIRICITSRPETDIKAVLCPLTFRSTSLHDESGQMEDINNYIKSVVNTDRMMRRWKATDKQLVIDMLTNKADGMFRYVDCQLGYLRRCIPGRIRHALEELPKTLDGTYERALKDLDEANWEVAHRLFQFVAVASRPLSVEELAQFLGFDFTKESIPKFQQDWLLEDPVDAVLSTTSSLLAIVNVGDSQVIQFSHFSVKEFLTSSRLAETSDLVVRRYHISLTDAHTLAARSCLGILFHLDKNVTAVDLENIRLAEYAAEHWVDHARFKDVFREVEDGAKQLFDQNKPHFGVWVWVHDLEDQYWHRGKREKMASEPRGTPLHYAALCGLDVIVNFLVVEHAQDVDSRGFDHESTALHLASRRGYVKAVRALLDNGADAEARNKRKSTPLHLASNGGHVGVVRALLERGVDANAEDNEEFTPFVVALRGGHIEVTNVFLELGVGSVAEVIDDWPPLPRALFLGNIAVARTLLECGADMTETFGDDLTSLAAALFGGHTGSIRVLIEHGVDITVKCGGENTALHLASITGNVEIVHFLLEHDLDVTARGSDGLTPLHWASAWGHVEVACLFLKHGADVTAQDDDEQTPLHSSSLFGQMESAHILLDHGANATAPDKDGRTPLHLSAEKGYVEVARLLLEHGAYATAEAKDWLTPLHDAAKSGYPELVRLLLAHGAHATARDKDRWTSLHFAAQSGHVKVARLLLEAGANSRATDNDGRTPLDIASRRGFEDLARILEHAADGETQGRGADATAQADDGRTSI